MTEITQAKLDEMPSEAEVFRTMHGLLETIAQIAENHGFERGDDLPVWLAKRLPLAQQALSAPAGEVVAWQAVDPAGRVHVTGSKAEADAWDKSECFIRPLYAHPPAEGVRVDPDSIRILQQFATMYRSDAQGCKMDFEAFQALALSIEDALSAIEVQS